MTEIVHVWVEKAHGDPGEDIPAATRQEAEERRDQIQEVMGGFFEQWVPLITSAYVHRDWLALGYAPGQAGWAAYCRDSFHPDVIMPPTTRKRLITGLHIEANMSQRAIAGAVGASPRTVGRQLAQDAADGSDAKVLSLDGKLRAAKAAKPAEVIEPDEIYVPEREREFPEVETAPPVIFSATPGNATTEAPKDALRVSAAWLSMARQSLQTATTIMGAFTGEFTDPGTFAAGADDRMTDELAALSRRLDAFMRDVWALRGRWVWMSAEREGLNWHELGTGENDRCEGATAVDEGKPWQALCGRTTAGGVVMPEVRARAMYGAKPCATCQEALS